MLLPVLFIGLLNSPAKATEINVYGTFGNKTVIEVVCDNNKEYKLLVRTDEFKTRYSLIEKWFDVIIATKCNKQGVK